MLYAPYKGEDEKKVRMKKKYWQVQGEALQTQRPNHIERSELKIPN